VPKAASFSVGKPRMTYLGRKFTHFQKSQPAVSYLAGEFYWQVRYGDRCEANDYVSPPLILSSEKTGNELTWSLGEYAEGPELWKAFKLPGKPPQPVGVAPNQPSPHEGKVLRYWLAFIAFVAAALVMQVAVMALNIATRPTPVSFHAKVDGKTQVVSPVFDIRGILTGPVIVRTTSNVRDTWLAVDLKLTEANTGRAYGLKRQLGYQTIAGTQDGSQDDVGEFPSIPPGRYTLTVDATAGASPTQYPPPTYNGKVEVYRASPSWASFWILTCLLILWPIAAWGRASSFETRRWSESDYAAGSGDDDDD
jgi:hypothetical protein